MSITQQPTHPRGSPPPPGSPLDGNTVIAIGATTARDLSARFADRYSVLDWLTVGQPDGLTDNLVQFQAALDVASGGGSYTRASAPGIASITIPGAPVFIVSSGTYNPVGGLVSITTTLAHGIPIGGTFELAAVNGTGAFANLNGSYTATASTSTTLGFTATANLPATTISAGLVSANYRLGGTLLISSNTHLIIESGATIRMKDGASGSCLGIVDGSSNILIELYGTLHGNDINQTTTSGGIVTLAGLPVTLGCKNVYVRGGGLGQILNFKNWPINLAAVTNCDVSALTVDTGGNACQISGLNPMIAVTSTITSPSSYNNGTGAISITTTIPHGLSVGATVTLFPLTGVNAQTLLKGTYTTISPTSGSVITCSAASGLGASITVTGGSVTALTGTYVSGTGVVTITTKVAHGISAGTLFTLVQAAGSGAFASLNGTYTAVSPTSGNTLTFNAPSGLGVATLTGGTLHTLNPSVNAGFSDCIIRNIPIDLGVCLYGGVRQGYMRRCSISHCNGGGATILSDPSQSGPNIDCEITDNVLFNNDSWGVVVTSNAVGPIHMNTLISRNHIYGNLKAAAYLSSVDGVLFSDNILHDNSWDGIPILASGDSGDINTTTSASRVSIINNEIRNTGVGTAATSGPTSTISSGSYVPLSGLLTITTTAGHGLTNGESFTLSGLTGTGAFANLNGSYIAATASGASITCTAQTGLAATTITGGTVVGGTVYGIAFDNSPYLRIMGNRIGDYQNTQSMAGCLKGTWGTSGMSEGNYYGPRINATADLSVYSNSSVQGISYDMTTGQAVAAVNVAGFVTLMAAAFGITTFPNKGLSVGWNKGGSRGEVNFLVGQAGGTSGGFDISQVNNTGTINAAVGLIGNLLSVDGLGNLRLSGALAHGAAQKSTLAAAGTLTVNANTDFVIVTNAASIASGTILLPALASPLASMNLDMEILYVSPIGALTISGAGGTTVANGPTTAAAGTSHKFILDGPVWRHRISQ